MTNDTKFLGQHKTVEVDYSHVTHKESHELVTKETQTKALASIANSLSQLTTFIQAGGLQSLLQGYSKAQAVGGILQGLTAHAGRSGLDARVLEQDALEIVHKIEAVYKKYQESLEDRQKKDPNIHDAETAYAAWLNQRGSQPKG